MSLPYKKIGIIGALDEEVASLIEKTNAKFERSALETNFYRANVNEYELVIARCGVGKVNAAIIAQEIIDEYGVDAMINVGVAGAIDSRIKRNGIVISEKLYEHDVDCLEGAGVISRMKTSEFVSDAKLVSVAKASCEQVCEKDNFFVGVIVSGDQFICTLKKREWLSEEFGALCAEMEGAAIAHTCQVNSIPFLVLRSICDFADEGAAESFQENKDEALDFTTDVVLKMLS